jgi:hypothetical protein
MINKCGCGGEAIICSCRSCSNELIFYIECLKCHYQSARMNDEIILTLFWNTAHPDTTALTSERDELKRQVAVRDKAIDLVFEIFILHDTMLSEATRGMTIAQTKEWLLAKAEEQV